MKQRNAIEARGIVKTYGNGRRGGAVALDGIDLDVREGEFLSLIGPSGCGKTTLLKVFDGLVPFDEGTLLVNDKETRSPGPERAVVFQSFALLPWRTVEGNVLFGLESRGVKRAKARETARHYLAMVGLSRFLDHYPAQLSGGMQQRVGLARALAVSPSILMMDEPFGALDAQTRTLLQDDLERIWREQQQTVVFVTHAMDEAVYLSDRIVLMSPRPGRVQEIIEVDLPRPRTDAIRSDPRFTELTSYIWDALRTMIVRDESPDGESAEAAYRELAGEKAS
jgi:NitT/TauT family transport system ATP-binding protein